MYKSVDTHKHARTHETAFIDTSVCRTCLIPLMLFKIIPRMFTEYRANILPSSLPFSPSFLMHSKFIIDAI